MEPQTERPIIQGLFQLLSQASMFLFSFKIGISSKLIQVTHNMAVIQPSFLPSK